MEFLTNIEMFENGVFHSDVLVFCALKFVLNVVLKWKNVSDSGWLRKNG